jgi:DNA-binding Lrp family transcriptional regulator
MRRSGCGVGLSEEQVLARLSSLLARGLIKRLGVIVRHHELGYRANAMVVWDIPDERVAQIGRALSRFPFVTLCYRRPRRLPAWPYNLFCMIHDRDREAVIAQASQLAQDCGLVDVRHELLFSKRRFKQCGARYVDSQDSRHADLRVLAETADG